MPITSLLNDIVTTFASKTPGQVNIDSKVFQLHYRVTTFLFLAFSLLSTTDRLLGEPINCTCTDCENSGISQALINTHCWVSGTYTIASSSHAPVVFDQGFHGLGAERKDDKRKFHMYYQWIPFVLFLQGILFYVPHWIWKINEDGRIASLAQQLRLPTTDRQLLHTRVTALTQYVADTMGSYDGYFLRFLICDLLNVVNVMANIVFINRYLNYEFTSYGPRCVEFLSRTDNAHTISPMAITFPKLTKCRFEYFGSSGTLQNLDAICVLALNIFNEKIYLFLWFWLIFLLIITVLVFSFRTVLLSVRALRAPFFQRRACTVNESDINDIALSIRVSDFFFLSLLAKNLDITAFRLFLSQTAAIIRSRAGDRPDSKRSAPSRAHFTGGDPAGVDEVGLLSQRRGDRENMSPSEILRQRQRAQQMRV